MKWHREIDYHGFRSYERESPVVNRSSLLLGWLAMIARERLRQLFSRPVSSTVLLHDQKRSFSLLGVSDANLRARERECPFPTTLEAARQPHRRVSKLRHED